MSTSLLEGSTTSSIDDKSSLQVPEETKLREQVNNSKEKYNEESFQFLFYLNIKR